MSASGRNAQGLRRHGQPVKNWAISLPDRVAKILNQGEWPPAHVGRQCAIADDEGRPSRSVARATSAQRPACASSPRGWLRAGAKENLLAAKTLKELEA